MPSSGVKHESRTGYKFPLTKWGNTRRLMIL